MVADVLAVSGLAAVNADVDMYQNAITVVLGFCAAHDLKLHVLIHSITRLEPERLAVHRHLTESKNDVRIDIADQEGAHLHTPSRVGSETAR